MTLPILPLSPCLSHLLTNSPTSGLTLSTTTNYQASPTQNVYNTPHYHLYTITTTYWDCQHVPKHDHTPHPSQGYYAQP
ncbi:hypothetical protein BDQ12DRAFT_725029 [Crucibulum laeve]|uniref:Uncharacterized protein n=1 Tax=Crucibulum laeve TaxID=68775 RepID=A0A5C3LW23_9AGAR|nr:hypothetical protein BDQ12DRAFT_725029 [Crucibulum laeve]